MGRDWKREQREKDMNTAQDIIIDRLAMKLIEGQKLNSLHLSFNIISCVLSDKLSLRLALIKTDYMRVLETREVFVLLDSKEGKIIRPSEKGLRLISLHLKGMVKDAKEPKTISALNKFIEDIEKRV